MHSETVFCRVGPSDTIRFQEDVVCVPVSVYMTSIQGDVKHYVFGDRRQRDCAESGSIWMLLTNAFDEMEMRELHILYKGVCEKMRDKTSFHADIV